MYVSDGPLTDLILVTNPLTDLREIHYVVRFKSSVTARSFEPYPLSYKVVRITPESLFHCATDGVLA